MKEVQKDVPLSVKCISGLNIFFGVLLFSLGYTMSTLTQVIFMAMAFLCFFTGWGLWKGREWARVAALIISAFCFLAGIIYIVSGDILGISILVSSWFIGRYLFYDEDIKKFFS